MARRTTTVAPSIKQPAVLTREQMLQGVALLERRLAEVKKFQPNSVTEQHHHPELDKLENSIDSTLVKVFGVGTLDYSRYRKRFRTGPTYTFGNGPSTAEVQKYVRDSREQVASSLQSAIEFLREELADSEFLASERDPPLQAEANTIFVVHGHDGEAKQSVARFLSHIGLRPIILHERPNMGRTVIQKFREEARSAGFAVVLLTPDDVGGKSKERLATRARQNVVFELGFFIGALGPSRVVALVKGDVERPSDIDGILYTKLDEHDGWKRELAREINAAGIKFDAGLLLDA